MLLILIPAAWIAIASFFVLLCHMTARGDASLTLSMEGGTPSRSLPGLVLFEDRADRAMHDERLGRRPVRPAGAPVRGRRARCVSR